MRKVVKRTNKKNKKLIWLVVLVLIVGIGFSALQKTLQINGNAIIDGSFSVGISGISKANSTGGASELSTPTFTDSTASFNVSLMAPGDSVTYDVTVQNGGSMNAKLEDLVLEQLGNSNITYEVVGIEEGFILASENEKIFQVKVSYVESNETDDKAYKEAKLTLSFVQTSESTEEQEEQITQFENRVSNALESYFVAGSDDEYVRISIGYGDGPGHPTTSLFNEYDVLAIENFGSTNIAIPWEKELKYKTKDYLTINGTRYSSQFSEVKTFYLENLNNTFITNRYDGVNKEIIYVYSNIYTITLPLNYIVKPSAFHGSTINKVIIPSDYKLSDLPSSSLENYYYRDGIKNVVLNTVVNLSGQSIDWAPIVGEEGLTCEFETGTCGSVTITNVE